MKFLGAPYPIRKTPRGLLATQQGLDQIKSDILVLLMTNPGERCLVGNTKIPLANGEEYFIKDLVNKESFWVYSYDHSTNSIVAGKATAKLTIKNASLVEVTLDNNEKVICTENHLWLLRNGEYKRTDELKVNESLMPFYRNLNTSGYERRLKNHKKLDYKEDCYDLHVEKYHNFALSSGVFVHNCMLPEYGTPLRELFFEPHDESIAERAREIIIDSIKQWEPRITVEQLDVSLIPDKGSLDPNDPQEDTEHILFIRISFFDPEQIQEVQELKLKVPLGSLRDTNEQLSF